MPITVIINGVMRDYYAKLNEAEVRELNVVCDGLREDAVATQERESEEEVCWCKFFESCPLCSAQERELPEEDLVECTGCGEQWFRHSFPHVKGDTIDWCRKCYKSDPYYV